MIEDYLNTFREAFIYKNVVQYDDILVYKIPACFCKEVSQEAQQLIDRLNLPLISCDNGRLFDSVVIKEKTNG